MTGVYLFIVYFFSICIHAQIFNDGDYLSDYPHFYPPDSRQDVGYEGFQKPEVIRQHSGTDITLKCNSTSCLYHKPKITWEFKPCQRDLRKIPCFLLYESSNEFSRQNSSWDFAVGRFIKRKCTINLELQNVSESTSGLYRCTSGSKLLKLYEVVIVDSTHKYSGQPPELLDLIPSNITIMQNTQIIIQCRVYSKQPPVIWWFKQSDGTNYDIQYSDKYYNRINTSVQVYAVPHEYNVYMSKLNIHQTRGGDSGVYVCVAMTESGKDYKEAIVNVITVESQEARQNSFFILFLIPIIFALIPITIWLCYYKRKRQTQKTVIQNHQEICLIRPIVLNETAAVL